MTSTFEALKAQLKALYAQLIPLVNVSTIAGDALYKSAFSKLGMDASPKDLAPDAYGCAETVTTILNMIDGTYPVILGTMQLYRYLDASADFIKVLVPIRGDIVVYATGEGGKNGVANGHTGIVGDNGLVMSNNSANGLFDTHLTLESMRARYRDLGGYPEHYYRKIV